MAAVAEIREGSIVAHIEIGASPDAVFRALVTPEEICSWWGSDDSYRVVNWVGDVRPGGAWTCEARTADNSEQSTVRGEYIIVDPPRILEHTWQPSWENFATTTVRYTLEPTQHGTRVSVLHTGFGDRVDAATGHAHGWTRVLGWLDAHFQPKEKHSAK